MRVFVLLVSLVSTLVNCWLHCAKYGIQALLLILDYPRVASNFLERTRNRRSNFFKLLLLWMYNWGQFHSFVVWSVAATEPQYYPPVRSRSYTHWEYKERRNEWIITYRLLLFPRLQRRLVLLKLVTPVGINLLVLVALIRWCAPGRTEKWTTH